jgi:hypothetical protein
MSIAILAVGIDSALGVTTITNTVITGVTAFISSSADPADAGILRSGNAESLCWEANPAGTDVCMQVDSNENFLFDSAIRLPVVTKSGAATLTDNEAIVRGDASGGTFTLTLPTSAGRAGKTYIIEKIDNSANAVTIDGNGAETINGRTTWELSFIHDFARIVSDGSNWLVMASRDLHNTWGVATDETTFAWSNQPSALTELIGTTRYRNQVDLTPYEQFRIVWYVSTAGTAGSVIGVQYSDDGGTTWRGLDNGTSGSNSSVTVSTASTGLVVSAWTNLATGAKGDIQVRIAGSGGDGVADPAYGTMKVKFR